MRILSLVLLALCASPAVPGAQTVIPNLDEPGLKGDMARAEKQRAAERFDALDADRNGKLSRKEVATKSAYLSESFDKLDTDKDGQLGWEEFLGHNRWPR